MQRSCLAGSEAFGACSSSVGTAVMAAMDQQLMLGGGVVAAQEAASAARLGVQGTLSVMECIDMLAQYAWQAQQACPWMLLLPQPLPPHAACLLC